MGLSTSLSNALSGLTAAARATDVVSSNISNAMTEGYARRELSLSPRSYAGTGGVRVDGVSRAVDQTVLRDLRLSDAETGNTSLSADFMNALEDQLGDPEDSSSLSGQISALDTALIEAASRPDSEARLTAVLNAAQGLSDTLNEASEFLTDARSDADQAIQRDVDFVNTSLTQLADLNATIVSETSAGRDPSALLDQRQALVGQISEVIPVIELPRDMNQIGLVTKGGAILLDGKEPVTLGFTAQNTVTADMSLEGGQLSGITLNGLDVPMDGQNVLSGGTLSAQFTLRDETAPQFQEQLDALARNLIERFSDSGTDPTISSGQPGLFTDSGNALDTANELGLASRISLNSAVDPNSGGALWRLRSGVGASSAGDVGDSTILTAMRESLNASESPASGSFLGAEKSFSGLAANLQSQVSVARLSADSAATQAKAQNEALTDLHLAQGVDTDDEMQKLLTIESSYAANARVIQTIEDMLDQIMRL